MAKAAKKTIQHEDIYPMLKITVSGSYKNNKNEIIDFEDLSGLIPACDHDIASMHVQSRYIQKWLKAAVNEDGEPKYPERAESIRQVFVDDIQDAEGELSFVGKSIKELTQDEMQDLATAKDLRGVPLPYSGLSTREMRERAYAAYSEKVLNKKIQIHQEGFNFAKLPNIILDGEGRIENQKTFTNEEIIENEQSNPGSKPQDRFTLAELKKLADGKNIQYPDDVTFDELFLHLFPA